VAANKNLPRTDSCRGQALAEFSVCLFAVIATLWGTTRALRAEWERARCAYQVFEAVHARLVGSSIPRGISGVQIQEGPSKVRGTKFCGPAREEVSLERLEPLGSVE
jgi:hypothetical protein